MQPRVSHRFMRVTLSAAAAPIAASTQPQGPAELETKEQLTKEAQSSTAKADTTGESPPASSSGHSIVLLSHDFQYIHLGELHAVTRAMKTMGSRLCAVFLADPASLTALKFTVSRSCGW
eukprot:GHVU01100692.1.p2 GENE.GHVU01100692.1~~GHVU01100692.1.p2  ORF type:complete len:120 (+),score=6.51 GHVU01100692.1:148-507(+)